MADSNAQMATVGPELKGALGVDPSARAGEQAFRSMEEHPAWPMIACLPVTLAVNIPLRGFRVCDLLNLQPAQTIESAWAVTQDVPLKAGALLTCWGEFEVVEQRMALRLTRLA
jgi:flagellar motor switch protein FliN/FliY